MTGSDITLYNENTMDVLKRIPCQEVCDILNREDIRC